MKGGSKWQEAEVSVAEKENLMEVEKAEDRNAEGNKRGRACGVEVLKDIKTGKTIIGTVGRVKTRKAQSH